MSGVTRRRVAGGGASSTTEGNGTSSTDIAYSASSPSEERKIAYDPKDLEDDKDKNEPKLTLMEEVLLLGLKDRQVSETFHEISIYTTLHFSCQPIKKIIYLNIETYSIALFFLGISLFLE
jgi:Golgi phosphoprotein 3